MITIKEWCKPEEQKCNIGRHEWHVPRLIWLAKDLEVMDIPLQHLNVYFRYDRLTSREMVMHMKAVLSADLERPIILDEDGEIMDGRHRVMKAMLNGEESIKAVRFQENPEPCNVIDD